MQNVPRDMAALLMRHYETARTPVLSSEWVVGEWSTLVRVVLEQGRSAKRDPDWSWIANSSLASAQDSAQLTVPRLGEVLEAAGYSDNKAALLRTLAEWWQRCIADADAANVFRSRSLEHWQDELRSLRGVNWELADRILLLVGGCSVYPLDRGSMRIALRHGWMDMSAEYDDWQAFFVSAARDAEVSLQQLWRWNVRTGRDFCGRRPDCENCPLKSLLPAGGPVPLEGDE